VILLLLAPDSICQPKPAGSTAQAPAWPDSALQFRACWRIAAALLPKAALRPMQRLIVVSKLLKNKQIKVQIKRALISRKRPALFALRQSVE
jgi:hypothetical protein